MKPVKEDDVGCSKMMPREWVKDVSEELTEMPKKDEWLDVPMENWLKRVVTQDL